MKILILSLLLSVYIHANPRIIALDWAITETLLALDVTPVGIGDKSGYSIWVKKPVLPAEIMDVGLRSQPNLAQLATLKPDIVLTPSALFGINQEIIIQYAPIIQIDFYQGQNLWEEITNATLKIGQIVHKEQEAFKLIEQTKAIFEASKNTLKENPPPIAVVQLIDAKQFRIYGKNSIFGTTLNQMGLENAFKENMGITNLWGISTIPITSLFKLPQNTRLIIIEPLFVDIDKEIKENSLYQQLNFFENRIVLEAIWSAGGLLSMQRFAHEVRFHLKELYE